MNVLKITRNTTNGEIERFCHDNPHTHRKILTAQAYHERRLKRSEHNRRQQELEDGNYQN
jgi:hypothetical protein